MSAVGVVKFFNTFKGFGFIETENGDVFVHANDVIGNPLVEGDQVNFDENFDEEKQKTRATNVTGGTGEESSFGKGGLFGDKAGKGGFGGKGKGGFGGKGGGFGGKDNKGFGGKGKGGGGGFFGKGFGGGFGDDHKGFGGGKGKGFDKGKGGFDKGGFDSGFGDKGFNDGGKGGFNDGGKGGFNDGKGFNDGSKGFMMMPSYS